MNWIPITAVVCIAAWLTHIIWSIGNAAWLALVAGAIFFPIGIIHGIMIWIGAA